MYVYTVLCVFTGGTLPKTEQVNDSKRFLVNARKVQTTTSHTQSHSYTLSLSHTQLPSFCGHEVKQSKAAAATPKNNKLHRRRRKNNNIAAKRNTIESSSCTGSCEFVVPSVFFEHIRAMCAMLIFFLGCCLCFSFSVFGVRFYISAKSNK